MDLDLFTNAKNIHRKVFLSIIKIMGMIKTVFRRGTILSLMKDKDQNLWIGTEIQV